MKTIDIYEKLNIKPVDLNTINKIGRYYILHFSSLLGVEAVERFFSYTYGNDKGAKKYEDALVVSTTNSIRYLLVDADTLKKMIGYKPLSEYYLRIFANDNTVSFDKVKNYIKSAEGSGSDAFDDIGFRCLSFGNGDICLLKDFVLAEKLNIKPVNLNNLNNLNRYYILQFASIAGVEEAARFLFDTYGSSEGLKKSKNAIITSSHNNIKYVLLNNATFEKMLGYEPILLYTVRVFVNNIVLSVETVKDYIMDSHTHGSDAFADIGFRCLRFDGNGLCCLRDFVLTEKLNIKPADLSVILPMDKDFKKWLKDGYIVKTRNDRYFRYVSYATYKKDNLCMFFSPRCDQYNDFTAGVFIYMTENQKNASFMTAARYTDKLNRYGETFNNEWDVIRIYICDTPDLKDRKVYNPVTMKAYAESVRSVGLNENVFEKLDIQPVNLAEFAVRSPKETLETGQIVELDNGSLARYVSYDDITGSNRYEKLYISPDELNGEGVFYCISSATPYYLRVCTYDENLIQKDYDDYNIVKIWPAEPNGNKPYERRKFEKTYMKSYIDKCACLPVYIRRENVDEKLDIKLINLYDMNNIMTFDKNRRKASLLSGDIVTVRNGTMYRYLPKDDFIKSAVYGKFTDGQRSSNDFSQGVFARWNGVKMAFMCPVSYDDLLKMRNKNNVFDVVEVRRSRRKPDISSKDICDPDKISDENAVIVWRDHGYGELS